jgi:Fe-S cluster assembly protein SufD
MTTRPVVTRIRRAERTTNKDFNFSREMVPGLVGAKGTAEYLLDYRSKAWDAFERLSLPTTSEDAWRRTDLHAMQTGVFKLHTDPDWMKEGIQEVPGELLNPLAGDEHGGQIILTPDGIQVKLDDRLISDGVIFTDLATAEKRHPEILARILGKIVRSDESIFSSMAASLAQLGILVYVPRGIHVEQPLHSILWGPGNDVAYFSHILVWLEEGASLTYVHESASPSENNGQALHVGIVEVHVGQAANLRLVELQSWGDHVWNFTHERVLVDRDGEFDWVIGAVGSHVSKNFTDLDLVGQGAMGRISGFYFTDGEQHLDLDTQQNHLAPHTTSDLLFKGALKGRSRSVWQGMIYVAPGAQKTDGYQANRNLVLSSQSRADSIPGLEILADDVRCTHGATVGKIDADQIFYLRSRGIPYSDAERLVVEGFFDPIMQRIPFEQVRMRFQKTISEKMG